MARLSAGISTTLPAPALNMVCKNQILTAIYCNMWAPPHDKNETAAMIVLPAFTRNGLREE